ncbi:unnamed protein product, partial [Scytosiphon promiscuus]
CVELQGIESGGNGLTSLNLTTLQETLGTEPFDISNPIIPTIAGCAGGLETPISMRSLLGKNSTIDTVAFSLSSVFSEAPALDIFGDKDTSDARRRCRPESDDVEGWALFDLHLRVAVMYAVAYLADVDMPYCTDVAVLMEERGHSLSLLEGNQTTDTPWGLAKTYSDEVKAFVDGNDGWNADGTLGGREYNLTPFSDFSYRDSAGNKWKGYTPKNSPYKVTKQKRWQPLMESDGLGYITAQEHVTPHIGVTARLFGFENSDDETDFAARKLNAPGYMRHYEAQARDVLEETKATATDEEKQFAISFFDNKFASLIPLKIIYVLARPEYTAIDFYRITVKVQLSIYNSVILAWREKIRHDAPRPPTVIRELLGGEHVETYAGPDAGVQTIRAEEWMPFIRTMPHSEYPSASSCICEAYVEQIREWLDGEDEIDPPIQFPPPELGTPVLEFSSWSEISEMCGDSRYWGGMHFERAVPAGVELCGGDDMARSISASIDALVAGDESAAVFKRNVGGLMIRPL